MKKYLLIPILFLFSSSLMAQTNLYVDGSVAASGAGTSWATAYKTLAEALNYVNNASTTVKYNISVAKGTYYPTRLQSGTNRDSALCIFRGGIKLYGGYPNGGGTRDYVNNPTILSGNINSLSDSTDNSYHVLVLAGFSTTDSLIIDGFTITKGNANGSGTLSYNTQPCNRGYGGGIYNNAFADAYVKIINITVISNNATTYGGGIYTGPNAPPLFNSNFISNTTPFGGHGGGIYAYDKLYITNCAFTGNTSQAVYIPSGFSYTFVCTNCTFNNNGGGIAIDGTTSNAGTQITNSTFQDNTDGGISLTGGMPITNCTFTNNSAAAITSGAGGTGSAIQQCKFINNRGGAVNLSGGGGSILQCEFTNNSGYNAGAVYLSGSSNASITNCTFTGNKSNTSGGAVYQVSGTLTGCTFNGNKASASGGAIYFSGNTISNCTIYNDTAGTLGGGIYITSLSTITNCKIYSNKAQSGGGIYGKGGTGLGSGITHCMILGNSASANGGGCFIIGNGSLIYTVNSTLIAGNSAVLNGGGLYSFGAINSSVISNVTIAGNNSTNGQALYDSASNQTIYNSIFYNGASGIFNKSNSNPQITYSDVQGGYSGTGNIDIDPKFMNPVAPASAPDTSGDYSLSPCSAAINAGNNSKYSVQGGDVIGNPRYVSPAVDMGAYEFQGTVTTAGTISGSSSVCTNATTTLTNTSTGGIWSSSNNAIATVVSSSGVVTGIAAGTDTITYTINAGTSCESKAIKIITVNVSPTVNSITGSDSLCQGSTTQLSNTTTGGVWKSQTTSIATVGSSGLVTGVKAGSASVTYTVTGGNSCTTAASKTVTVNPLPSVPAITGSTSVCANQTVQLSNSLSGGVWLSQSPGVATVNNSGLVSGIAPGSSVIQYTVTNSYGCVKSASVTMQVPAITATVTQNNSTLSATLSGASYQWVNCPGYSFVSGQTNKDFTAAANGEYAVIITNKGCKDTSACYNIINASVEELNQASNAFKIYPNPVTDELQIANYQFKIGDEISVTDIMGKVIAKKIVSVPTSDFLLPTSNYAAGIYFLHINNECRKFIKE